MKTTAGPFAVFLCTLVFATAVALAVPGGRAHAAAPPMPATVFLDLLTWEEVRDALAAGKTTVIVPTGGTEQNGPHMALGKHNVRVSANAEAIARRLGNALVAPVMAYVPEGNIDPPGGHMRFPGTLSVPDAVFRQLLEYAARSLKQHGFRDIVFIGDSGPNQPGQTAVAALLNAEWAGGRVRVHAVTAYYEGDAKADLATLRQFGVRREEQGEHADIVDTSLMLAIDPSLVRSARLQAGDGRNGVDGDPRRASAALGRALIENTLAHTVAAIRKAIAQR